MQIMSSFISEMVPLASEPMAEEFGTNPGQTAAAANVNADPCCATLFDCTGGGGGGGGVIAVRVVDRVDSPGFGFGCTTAEANRLTLGQPADLTGSALLLVTLDR